MSKEAKVFQWLLNCTDEQFDGFLDTPIYDAEPEALIAVEAMLALAED